MILCQLPQNLHLPLVQTSWSIENKPHILNAEIRLMSLLHHSYTHHSLWEISIDGLDKLKKTSDLEKRK